MLKRTSTVVILSVAAACSGQAVDVGSKRPAKGGSDTAQGGAGGSGSMTAEDSCPTQPPSSITAGMGPAPFVGDLPEWPATASCDSLLQALAGEWTGYIQGAAEDFHPPLPSDGNVTLTVEAGDAEGCASLAFGEPIEYPPATDPKAPYPEGTIPTLYIPILPGFRHRLLNPRLDGPRLRFQINRTEGWQSWCRLQTPRCDRQWGGYHCAPAGYFSDNGDGTCSSIDPATGAATAPTSCAQAIWCRNPEICLCDSRRCDANLVRGETVDFDIHIDGDKGTGIVSGPFLNGQGTNAVHLQRRAD